MPKIHRHRGVTTEVPMPGDPVEAEVVEPIVVDEHGDDAAAVAPAPEPAPSRRARSGR